MCPSDDLLLVEDIVLVRQTCTAVTVEFDDESVADFFDEQVDRGLHPEQVGRIWIHTHPGDCPLPSGTDERTFARVFGHCEWALMFILAECGQTYARLQFNVGPKGSMEIPVEVDYRQSFTGSDHEAWEQEYLENVAVLDPLSPHDQRLIPDPMFDRELLRWPMDWDDPFAEEAEEEMEVAGHEW